MPTYWYRGLAEGSVPAEGTVVASSRPEAIQQILSKGQHPLDLREQAPTRGGESRRFHFRRRIIRPATFTRQVATMSASGVPIVKGLNVLIEQAADARARDLLVAVRESVQGGSTFADALAEHPVTFPPLMTSMVRVGERGGALDEVLLELSELFEKEESLKGEVQAAIAYPALVLTAGILSAIVLVTFFIPKLEEIFADVGQNLPAPTRLLLGLSHFIAAHRLGLAVALLLVLVGLRWLRRQERFRAAMDGYVLRAPWFGNFLRNLAVARLARLLGTLIRGGVSIVEALGIVEPVLTNRVISQTVRDMTARIRTGEALGALMRQSRVFPPLAVQMVAVGEESGQLDQMLLRVAEAYERETTAATKVMTSMLAPALILVVASIVGFILVSMMLPIFQMSTVLR